MKERMFRWLEWSTVVVMEMFLLRGYYISRNTCLSITLADQTVRPGWIGRVKRVGLADQASTQVSPMWSPLGVKRRIKPRVGTNCGLGRVFDRRVQPKQ
jgi:hypothetical protein